MAFFSLGIRLRKGQPYNLPDEKRCVNPTADGDRCKRPREPGGTQCRFHGNAPHVQSAVQRRHAAEAAKSRAIQKYQKEGSLEISGAEDVIDLLEERMGVQIQMARALDEIVGKLTAASEMRYEHRAGEQLRGEVQVWLQLNQQLTKLGADYLKIGLDERKVQIAEAQAKILVGVIRAVLDRLDLTGEQRRVAARAVPEELERAAVQGEVVKLWPGRLILAPNTATGLSSVTRRRFAHSAGRRLADGLVARNRLYPGLPVDDAIRDPAAAGPPGTVVMGCKKGNHYYIKGKDGRWHCVLCPAVK